MMLLLSLAWPGAVLYIPSLLGRAVDPASSTVRVAVASGVLIFFLVGSIYSYGRLQVERLARDPGPLLILAFKDYASASGENSHTGERLQAAFQQHLLATRLRGITGRFQSVMTTQCSAISSSKTSTGFRQPSVFRGLPFSSAATLS
ncbi:MAG: hypothetical protein ABIZ05_11350, partial [Pseudonocardiaceae bacterium]